MNDMQRDFLWARLLHPNAVTAINKLVKQSSLKDHGTSLGFFSSTHARVGMDQLMECLRLSICTTIERSVLKLDLEDG